jgi:hypothetical protein
MPREARIKKPYSYYHISQTCDKDISVFKSKEDKMNFIKTLKSVKEKYDFRLYGVGISKKGYDLLLYDNGNDITKIMRSINISFAMQYKCKHEDCKVVFKERYKSEIITPEIILALKKKLPLCVYMDESLLDECKVEEKKEECIDCYVKAKEALDGLLEEEGLSEEEMLKDKALRNDWIKRFRKTSLLNLSQIGQLFGGISESGVSKILKK